MSLCCSCRRLGRAVKCQRVWCSCQDSGLCTEPPFPPSRPCSSPRKREQAPAPWVNRLQSGMTDTGRWGGRLVEKSLNTERGDRHFNTEWVNYTETQNLSAFGDRVGKHWEPSEEHVSRWFSGENYNLVASLKQLSVIENKTILTCLKHKLCYLKSATLCILKKVRAHFKDHKYRVVRE